MAPEVQGSVSPLNGPTSTQFTFSAAGSVDPDNNVPLQYRWNFGDGSPVQTTSSLTISHQYTANGTVTATLTVIDSGSPSLTSPPFSVKVFVGNTPPTATIVLTNTTQAGRALFHGDDVWQYAAANASDDMPLPADAFLWNIVFHHRDHTHPFMPNLSGKSGSFTIPSTGEVDPIVWYRVTLLLKDSDGQVSTIIRDVYPETTTLRFTTNPAGGAIMLDGAQFTTPINITRVIGIHGIINVPEPQSFGGRSYGFLSWAHGGSQSQQIVVPQGGTTFTANLKDAGTEATATPISPSQTPPATSAPVGNATPTGTLPTPAPTNTANPALRNRFFFPVVLH